MDFLGHGDLAPAGFKSTPVRGIMLPGPINDPDFRRGRSARYCRKPIRFAYCPNPRRLCGGVVSGFRSMALGLCSDPVAATGATISPADTLGKAGSSEAMRRI
jgi:hypothetical protein